MLDHGGIVLETTVVIFMIFAGQMEVVLNRCADVPYAAVSAATKRSLEQPARARPRCILARR